MHSTLHQIYAPVFRRTYLTEFMHLDPQQVETIMQRERVPPSLPQQPQAQAQTTNATQSAPGAVEPSAEVPASSSDAPPPSMPPSPPPQPQALPLEQQQELFAQMTARIAVLEAKLAQHEAAAIAAAAAAASSSSPPSLSISPSEALKDDIVNLFAQQQGTSGEQRGF